MADVSPPRTDAAAVENPDPFGDRAEAVLRAEAGAARSTPACSERGMTLSLFAPEDWPDWQKVPDCGRGGSWAGLDLPTPSNAFASSSVVAALEADGAIGDGPFAAASTSVAPRDRMAQPGDNRVPAVDAPTQAAQAAQWLSNPGGAFVVWLRSPLANRGRGFSDDSMRVYAAMWGKFVRFAVDHGASAALANEGVLRAFIEALGQERIAQANALPSSARPTPLGRGPGAATAQAARSRDSGGVGRQARRYLSLLSRLQAHLVTIGVRDDNPALVVWTHFEAEPDRPDPSALAPGNDQKLRAALAPAPDAPSSRLGPADSKGAMESDPAGPDEGATGSMAAPARPAEPHWRDLRDRAIVELLVGSGLTSRQLRALRDALDHIDLDGNPAWVVPVPARRGQVRPGRVPLSPDAAAAVRLWLDLRRHRIPGDVLFPSNLRGDAMSAAALYRAVADAMRHAQDLPGVPAAAHMGPRTLRHTFAIRQLRAGKPLDVLQRWLGHRHLKSTAVYERLVPDPKGVKPV